MREGTPERWSREELESRDVLEVGDEGRALSQHEVRDVCARPGNRSAVWAQALKSSGVPVIATPDLGGIPAAAAVAAAALVPAYALV